MPLASKTFADIITFTRGSTGTYFDTAGVLQSAAINVPRFDYDPTTLLPRGILIETSITNRIRNNTMVGAAAGTPGTLPTNWITFTGVTGLTREIVGTGTESGITYIDVRLSGTPSAAGQYNVYFEQFNSAVAATGQTWTTSAYLRLMSGSFTGISAVRACVLEFNATPVVLDGTYTVVATPTGSPLVEQRVSASRTLNQATTAYVVPMLRFDMTGVAIDFTVRIGMPQLEQLLFPTSVVPTSTVAVTRAIDAVNVNTLSPWFNSAAGTLYAIVSTFDTNTGGFPRASALSDGTASNTIVLSRNASLSRARMTASVGGVSQVASNTTNTWAVSSVVKTALAYKTNNYAIVLSGDGVITDTLGAVPTITTMRIGGDTTATNTLNGHIKQLAYYSVRLTNTDLQAITV